MNRPLERRRHRGEASPTSTASAPPRLRPAVLAEVGLADRYARVDSPIGPLLVAWNGRGVSASTATGDDGAFEARHVAATGRPAYPAETLPPQLAQRHRAPPGRRPAGPHRPRPARPQPVRAGRLAQGARDPARRGPAVRLDRRRDRSPAGGPGGGHRPRPQPGAAHRARATGSSGPTASSASTRWAGRRTSGRSCAARASTPRPWRPGPRPASATSARTRPTSCACRPAATPDGRWTRTGSASGRSRPRSRPATGRARSAGRTRGRRWRPRTSRPAPGVPARPDSERVSSEAWTISPMPTKPMPRAVDRGPLWLGMLVLYVVWGSTYLGIAIAVETIPPFLMAAVRFAHRRAVLLGWCVLRARGAFVLPTRREWRDSAVVGALLLGGGHGHGRLGRADHPVGHRRPAHRDDAGLGRDLRPDLPRRAAAAPGGRRHRRRLRGRGHPRRPDRPRRGRRPRPARPWRRSSSRRSPGRSARCMPRTGRSCPASRSWRRAPRCCSARWS